MSVVAFIVKYQSELILQCYNIDHIVCKLDVFTIWHFKESLLISALRWILGSWTVGSYDKHMFCLFVLRNCQAIFQRLLPFCVPTSNVWEFLLLCKVSRTSYACIFKFIHSSRSVVESHFPANAFFSYIASLGCFSLLFWEFFTYSAYLHTSPLSYMKFPNISPISIACLFVFLTVSFKEHNILVSRSHFAFIYLFFCSCFDMMSENLLPNLRSWRLSSKSLEIFIFSPFTFRSLIYFHLR